MKKKQPWDMTIVTLAYAHHYIYPLLIVGIPLIVGGGFQFLCIGVGLLCYAAYTLVGYILHWKHIYCSFSIPRRAPKGWKMKTNNYNWKSIKVDVVGVSIMIALIGVFCLLGHFGVFN